MSNYIYIIMGIVALYVLSTVMRRRREPVIKPTTTYATSPATDPQYRFGGRAQPEYRITYVDSEGVVTERDVYVEGWHAREGVQHIRCWCFLRDEKRQFRSDRILSAINLATNRKIKDIVAHQSRW